MSQRGLLIVQFLAQGTMLVLMREIAKRRVDPFSITASIALTTALLAGGAFFLGAPPRVIAPFASTSALLGGSAFFLAVAGAFVASAYGRQLAQQHLPSYVEGPLSRISMLIVVVTATAALGERRSMLEMVGILLAFLPLVLIHVYGGAHPNRAGHRWFAIIWLLLATLCAAGVQLSQKIAVDPKLGFGIPPLGYVLGCNVATALVTSMLTLGRALLRKGAPTASVASALPLAVVVGVLNAIGFTCQSLYLVRGDASILFPLTSLNVVIPIVYGLVRRKERFNWASLAAVGLSLIATLLLAGGT
jgi:drug/metabolite transporter (DMT)-like permease